MGISSAWIVASYLEINCSYWISLWFSRPWIILCFLVLEGGVDRGYTGRNCSKSCFLWLKYNIKIHFDVLNSICKILTWWTDHSLALDSLAMVLGDLVLWFTLQERLALCHPNANFKIHNMWCLISGYWASNFEGQGRFTIQVREKHGKALKTIETPSNIRVLCPVLKDASETMKLISFICIWQFGTVFVHDYGNIIIECPIRFIKKKFIGKERDIVQTKSLDQSNNEILRIFSRLSDVAPLW
jgi:hypothetical protein